MVALAELALRAAALVGGDAWVGLHADAGAAAGALAENPVRGFAQALRERQVRVSSNKPADTARQALLMYVDEANAAPMPP